MEIEKELELDVLQRLRWANESIDAARWEINMNRTEKAQDFIEMARLNLRLASSDCGAIREHKEKP